MVCNANIVSILRSVSVRTPMTFAHAKSSRYPCADPGNCRYSKCNRSAFVPGQISRNERPPICASSSMPFCLCFCGGIDQPLGPTCMSSQLTGPVHLYVNGNTSSRLLPSKHRKSASPEYTIVPFGRNTPTLRSSPESTSLILSRQYAKEVSANLIKPFTIIVPHEGDVEYSSITYRLLPPAVKVSDPAANVMVTTLPLVSSQFGFQ